MTSQEPAPRGRGPTYAVIAAVVVAIAGLIAALLVLGGDDEDGAIDTVPETSTSDVPTSVSSVPVTEPPETTVPETTEPPETTAPPTEPPTTTEPALPTEPGGDLWIATSPYFETPFEMHRVAESGGLVVYDGRIDESGLAIRCIAVMREGQPGWVESCTEPDAVTPFVVIAGIDPWLVEADGDTVTLSQQSQAWSLPTNGCSAPVVTLVSTAEIEPAVMSALVCVPGQAFLSFSSVFLQPGPADGGGTMLEDGDEGWNSYGGGTSFPCDDPVADGVNRCEAFGVEFELFEALLPLPRSSVLPGSTDVVAVTDATATVRGWVGTETGADAIESIVVAQVSDPDAEVPATSRRAAYLSWGLGLVVVDVPAMDDSVASTSWAVWIGANGVVRATSFDTCARGLAGVDACV